MDLKYRFNNTLTFKNELRMSCSEDPISAKQQSFRNYAYTEADRHRPKPRRLLPTYLRYIEDMYSSDTNEYGCDKYPCGTSYRSGFYEYVNNSQTYKWSRRSGSSSASSSNAVVQKARLAAGQAFTSKIANFGESLSELDETGKMIHKRASQIVSMANALRFRNFGRLESIIKRDLPQKVKRLPKGKELANGWLELEFGWKPLVQDVYDAIEAYRSGLATRGQVVTAPGMKSGYYKPSSSELSYMNRYSNLEANVLTDKVKSKAYGVVSDPTALKLNELGLANPALLAWQLLPFSFVVDWFLPISQILGTLTNRRGLSHYVICVVYEYNKANQWRCDPVLARARKEVTRFVFSSAFAGLTTLSPRSLGLWHAATASALIRQSFGK